MGKKFSTIFGPLGVPQAPPRSRLRGNLSKIASVVKYLLPWGVSMQNLKSLACSVWAVGGGWFENWLHILYSEETCTLYIVLTFRSVSGTVILVNEVSNMTLYMQMRLSKDNTK